MKLHQLKPIFEAAFSAKNFPEDGNEDFSGAGERTNYIESEKNDDGFPLLKTVKVIPLKGNDRFELENGNLVHITRPGRLYRGEEIGATPATGVFTKIGRKSPKKKDAIGYVPLSAIEKPAGAQQSRMQTGSSSQEAVAEKLQQEYGDDYEFVSTATKGSTVPDLVVKIKDQQIQFEIKGTTSPTAPITFFDKSVRRQQQVPLLDKFASTLSYGEASSFTQLVDLHREQQLQNVGDEEEPQGIVGFPGDEGTPKSGKLPKEFEVTEDQQLLSRLREDIIEHFGEGGDNYFAIHNRSNDQIDIYHTGHGPNPLNEGSLPQLRSFKLATYGGPSRGAMRVGLKIKL